MAALAAPRADGPFACGNAGMANIRDRMMPTNVLRFIAQHRSERGRTAMFTLTVDIAFRNACPKSFGSSFLSVSFRPMASVVRALAVPKREKHQRERMPWDCLRSLATADSDRTLSDTRSSPIDKKAVAWLTAAATVAACERHKLFASRLPIP